MISQQQVEVLCMSCEDGQDIVHDDDERESICHACCSEDIGISSTGRSFIMNQQKKGNYDKQATK